MSVDDLSLFSEAEARDAMARAGFKDLQQRKLLQAVAPQPAAASPTKAAHASSPASGPLDRDWAALKRDGYTAREFRLAGCDVASALAVGFDLPSLRAAGFDVAAFRAAGCSWVDIKSVGFTARELRASGCDLAAAKAAGYDVPSLLSAFHFDAVIASGCDVSSYVLVSCATMLTHIKQTL